MNAAFIPVRGGSKSIPLKNIKLINGKPLVYWSIIASCRCKYIHKVYVSTDSEIIKNTVENIRKEQFIGYEKLNIIERSPQTATDLASTESAMLEFAQKYEFENIVLIQATSPLLTYKDLNKGFEIFELDNTDSVLSAVRQKRFYWDTKDEFAAPLNYDYYNRPRRQDFNGVFLENGAFYITSKELLLKNKNRISGKIRIAEMCEESAFEIDEESDWIIVEALMQRKKKKIRLSNIKMFLTDCDGCLTDGGMYYSEKGDELKKFNVKDGIAFSLLKKLGIFCGIITGENVRLNENRAKKLELDVFVGNCKNKLAAVNDLCERYNISIDQVLYVGDELNDCDVMKRVGIACCPADACDEIKKLSDYISEVKGGEGVIRDIVNNLVNS